MTHKTNIPEIDRVVYFSSTGDDISGGHSPELPKSSCTGALAEAEALDPIPSMNDPVWIHADGGATGFDLSDGVFCALDFVLGDITVDGEWPPDISSPVLEK